VGVIGKPNAGKSTLLSRLSRARPEIAPYPFTTKYPNLGRVEIDLDRSFIMADLPGLVEGAHAGAGLGHEFLRHIQRAGILVHLVEPEPLDGSTPLANYRTVRDELRKYDAQLAQRPEIVAVSKADLPAAATVHRQLADALGRDVVLMSAVTGQGLNDLVRAIVRAGLRWTLLDGTGRVTARMYGSFRQAAAGFAKNLYARFGHNLPLFAFVWTWLLWVTWQPLVVLALWIALPHSVSCQLASYAATAVGLSAALWLVTDLRFRVRLDHVLFAPLTVLAAAAIAGRSLLWTLLRRGSWKARPIPGGLPPPRATVRRRASGPSLPAWRT